MQGKAARPYSHHQHPVRAFIPVYMSATPAYRHPLSSYTEVIEGA